MFVLFGENTMVQWAECGCNKHRGHPGREGCGLLYVETDALKATCTGAAAAPIPG